MLQPSQSYGKATSKTHNVVDISTGMAALKAVAGNAEIQAEITVKSADLVIKFGTSSAVEADGNLTGDAFPAGNYECSAGTVKTVRIPPNITHFSSEVLNASTVDDGRIYLTIGHGENL